MAKTIGFALGGGGARGALQVGALRALFEHGIIIAWKLALSAREC